MRESSSGVLPLGVLGAPLKQGVRDHRQALNVDKASETGEFLQDPEVVFVT